MSKVGFFWYYKIDIFAYTVSKSHKINQSEWNSCFGMQEILKEKMIK